MYATSGFRERERFAGSFMHLPVMPRQPRRSCRARMRSARATLSKKPQSATHCSQPSTGTLPIAPRPFGTSSDLRPADGER
eukprot:15283040-Heterocapsa_arctica.AAC.1